jgi:hypothetical protein
MASHDFRYHSPNKGTPTMYSHDVSPLISPTPAYGGHRLPPAGRRGAAVVEWMGEIIAMAASIVALVVAGIAWTINDRTPNGMAID